MPQIRSASLLLALSLCPLLGQAKARAGAQDWLPASTYAAVGFAGLERCSAAIAGHDVAALVKDVLQRLPKSAFDSWVTPHLDQAADEVRRELDQVGVSAATLRAVLRRPTALGVGRLTVRGMGPSMALVIDEGDAGAEIDALAASLVKLLAGELSGLTLTESTVGGLPCRALESPDMPTIYLVHSKGAFVATNSEPYLREILATVAGQQPSIARASALGAQRARLGDAPLFEIFGAANLLAMLEPVLPYEAAEIGDALGVRSLGGVYAGVAPSRGGTAETFDVALSGPTQGLLKATFAGPADLTAAEFCSADAVAFGALHCDPLAVVPAFDRLAELLPASAGVQMQRGAARGLRMALRQAGIDQQQFTELLRSVGGTLSFAVTLAKGAMPMPELLVMLPVRDPKVVGAWIERATAMAAERGVTWKTRQSGDHEIRYCEMEAMHGMQMPVAPCFVLADGWLLAGTQPRGLIAALKQRGERDGSLAATDDFAVAAKENPGAGMLLHIRGEPGLEVGWRTLETWALPMLDAQQEHLGFGRDVVPEQEVFAKALGTSTLSATVDAEGVRLRSRSNFGFGGLLAGGASLLDQLLERAAGKIY